MNDDFELIRGSGNVFRDFGRVNAGVAQARAILAAERTIEFFTAQIRNPNTRKAYARAVSEFAAWCAEHRITALGQVRPVHIAAYVEGLQHKIAAP